MAQTQTETTDERIARAKREILHDVMEGIVPFSVDHFSELHQYVDANEYGGILASNIDQAIAVEAVVDEWLRAGGIQPPALPDGWELWHTGGNCTAWGRNLTGHKDAYAMITGDESAEVPRSREQITLGLYMNEEDDGTCHEGLTLSEALAWVRSLEADGIPDGWEKADA